MNVLRTTRSWLGALGLLALSGCGYFLSGSWDDDPENWERAFGSTRPVGAEVVHSRFTRYPHFTYEATFYFQLRLTDELRRTLLEKRFRRLEGPAVLEAKRATVPSDAPAWFAPEAPARYDAWTLDGPRVLTGTVLRDRHTGDLFLFMSQL